MTCAWCPGFDPTNTGGVSHGICPACAALFEGQMTMPKTTKLIPDPRLQAKKNWTPPVSTCTRCGVTKRGEYNQFATCRNTDACKRRAAAKLNPAAVSLGRLGGQAGTPAQDAARARNAQHAGRPGRVCTKCGEPVVGGHQNRMLDLTCGAHGWKWRQGQQ